MGKFKENVTHFAALFIVVVAIRVLTVGDSIMRAVKWFKRVVGVQ